MKILQINAVGQYGSTGRTCKELAQYINSHTEHRCYTAFRVGEVDEYSYRIGNVVGAKFHSLCSRISGKQAHFSAGATRNLIDWIEQVQPDVVHLRNLHSNYIHFPMLMKYLAKENIPTVVTLHDCWFFTAKCCHYTVDGCGKWQSGCHHCPRLRKDNPSWFFDATPQLWREKKQLFEAIPKLAVTGVSKWVVEEAEKSYLRCAKELIRIYNWVDLETFAPTAVEPQVRSLIPEGKHMVLGVASGWHRAKGLDEFLTLAENLGKDYVVCLAGAMPDGIRLPENLVHIPATNSAQLLAQLYTMANVFVTLSAEETFGKVSAEALACGTPVVCYDSTANKELVGEGCGFAHKLGDLKAIEASVRQICSTGKQQYTAVCRAFAKENFNKEDRIGDYLSLYERITR